MRAYINEQWFNVDDGATITTTFNETLDSASIRISHLEERMENLEPFDEVRLEYMEKGIGKIKYFCVDSFVETRKAFDKDNNMYYTYDIELFSPTKILENTILPNISITPYKTRTPLSIYDFIIRVISQYGPKIYDETQQKYVSEYGLDVRLTTDLRFGRDCPELQWTTPTLREVLNDLFMLCDCIVTLDLSTGNITFLDLTQLSGYEITDNDINFVQRTQSSNDYASELKMNLQNVTQTDTQDVLSTVITYEALSFVSDNFIVDSNNFFLQTKFPILNIKHLWVNFMTQYEELDEYGARVITNHFWRADLCNLAFKDDNKTYSLVKEKSEYDVTPVDKYTGSYPTTTIADFANNKNNCCYFTRGTNIIAGFGTQQKVSVVGYTDLAIKRMMYAVEYDKNNAIPGKEPQKNAWGGISAANCYFTPTFQIEYETSAGCLFIAEKSKKLKHQRTVMDNQTNSWVDITSQSKLECLKADRISNKMYLINSRKKLTGTNERYISIGDVYDNDKIVYNTTWQFNQNNCLINAYAAEKYVLRDYFTGINSKIRTWVNAKEEAFIRHEIRKYYITATLEPLNREVEIPSLFNWYVLIVPNGRIMFNYVFLLSPLIDYENWHGTCLQRAYVTTIDENNTEYPDTDIASAFNIELSIRYAHNSILITTGFDDNRIGVKKVNTGEHRQGDSTIWDAKIDQSDIDTIGSPYTVPLPRIDPASINGIGGIPLSSYMYADEEGSFEQIEIGFTTHKTDDLMPANLAEMTLSTIEDQYYNRLAKQIYYDNLPEFTVTYDWYKDNKEIIQVTTQFIFTSDTDDIILTEDFVRMQQMIYTGIQTNNFTYTYIYANTEQDLPNATHTITDENHITIEPNDPTIPILITPDWYCIKKNGKLLVKTKHLDFYIELRTER